MLRLLMGLLLLSSPALSDECGKGAIYEARDYSGALHILKTGGFVDPYVFEMHGEGKKKWSITAEQGCSNGIPFCWVSIPSNQSEAIDIAVEEIREYGKPAYMVFAHLSQSLMMAHRNIDGYQVAAYWPSPPENEGDKLVAPVNVYKFKSCR